MLFFPVTRPHFLRIIGGGRILFTAESPWRQYEQEAQKQKPDAFEGGIQVPKGKPGAPSLVNSKPDIHKPSAACLSLVALVFPSFPPPHIPLVSFLLPHLTTSRVFLNQPQEKNSSSLFSTFKKGEEFEIVFREPGTIVLLWNSFENEVLRCHRRGPRGPRLGWH